MSDEDMFEGDGSDFDYEDEDQNDDEEMNAFDDDATGPSLKRIKSFDVLSEEDITEEVDKTCSSVADILGLEDKSVAGVLLRHFKWNKDALIQAYSDNPEKVRSAAGIGNLHASKPSPSTKVTCLVCLESVDGKDTFALGCGHLYCIPCWKSYLEIKIQGGSECVFTRCMRPKCNEILTEDAVKKLLSPNVEDFKRYKQYLLRSFIADNPMVKWCPAPNCTFSIHCERKYRPVTCKCGFSFCFNCCDYKIGDHTPATCAQVERWINKASDESENVNWLLSNTKRCPQCRAPIEKNGGCMHMVCQKNSGGCGYEFCWLCRGDWSEHGRHTGGYYNCNKYEKSDAKKDDESSVDIKTELEHYMFYYHRYQSHQSARKVAIEQKKKLDKKALKIQNMFEVRYQDTKFLIEATDQLITNGRVLEYSYVYGYYLDKKKVAEKNLFEDLQENLEKHTNYLRELYEMKLSKLSGYQQFFEWKEKVTNYTRVTRQFCENFLEGVAGGLTSS